MTFKLEPFVEKVKTPIRLILPDGNCKEYTGGEEAYLQPLDHHYNIESIYVDNSILVLKLVEFFG